MKSNRSVFLLTPLACACSLACAQSAVLPTGGSIVRGSGSITTGANSVLVRQTSDRLVADWTSFSIGAGQTVRFVQPGRDSVALNRVLGDDASHIYGHLLANGQVFLQNPNGVLFAPGAQVSVGALVATTLNTDAARFMEGQLRLSGGGDGAVRNAGTLRAAEGGYLVLAAPRVTNAGVMLAPGGTAALAAGAAVEIDPTGAGLMSVRVPVSAIAARVANSGAIVADGGRVSLQAAATQAALDTVMQVGGVVRARSIEQRDGQVFLSGGSSGVVRVSGRVDASGGTGQHGGEITVLGERIGLLGNARLDASGGTGGGTVQVGGGLRGEGALPHAALTVVGADASIDASARVHGDGGTAVVWSDAQTRFEGRIAARGAGGGDGGLAEVSGKQHLSFLGSADLRAPGGRRGTLLLDPSTLTIGATANLNGDATPGDDLVNPTLTTGEFIGAASQITATRVATLLATTDVSLAADFQISVTAPLSVLAGGAASTLTLASPSVSITAPVTLNNSSLAVSTGGFSDSVFVGAPVQSLGSVSFTSSNVSIGSVITAAQVNFDAPVGSPSFVSQDPQVGGIVAAQVNARSAANGPLSLSLFGPQNRIGSLTLDVADADVRIDNPAGSPMSVQGTVSGALNLDVTGGLAQAGALSVSGATGIITRGSDAARLTNAGNAFAGGVDFTAAGDFAIAAAGPLTLAGRGSANVTATSTGVLTLGTSGINTTGALIDITSAGFVDATDTGFALQTGAGGRFIVRSSDFAADNLRTLGFGGTANDFNHIVFSGWTGALPNTGNMYITNASATLATSPTEQAAVSRVYDGTTAFNYQQNGGAAAGTITTGPGGSFTVGAYTARSTGDFADKNAGTDKAYTVAASTNVIGAGRAGERYYGMQFAGFTRAAGPGTAASVVTPRAITSTGITAADRVYDASTDATLNTAGGRLAGTIAGDVVTLDATGATGTVADRNVGTAKPVTITGVALAGADAGNYTVTDASNATMTITPRPISADGVTAVNRVYDGTRVVTLNTSAATLNGVLGEDFVTIAASTGTMADKNVGVGKTVTGTLALGGSDAGNYIATPSVAPTVTITPRALTSGGVRGVDRAYDGSTAVALDGSASTLTGVVTGDAVTLSLANATGAMADKNVGTNKAVTVTGLALAGGDAGNYTLTDTSAPTVNISALALQLSGLRAVNRVVNGTTQVDLITDGLQVSGLLPSDAVAVDARGAVGSVSSPAAGFGKPVTISGVTLTGADAANYTVAPLVLNTRGEGLTVRIFTPAQAAFEDVRFTRYLQGLSDAQEPFRRAMAEALAAGFGKENIRKQLSRGLVFETGLAAPAVDQIDGAKRPDACTGGAAGLACR